MSRQTLNCVVEVNAHSKIECFISERISQGTELFEISPCIEAKLFEVRGLQRFL